MATPGACVIIDGREVEVPAGTGLVEAAAKLDIEIPVFCYEPRIGPAVGACRMCLVEIEGMPKLQTACSTGARDGMVVSTVSDRAREAQEAVLEFLLINHPLDCPVCDKGGECPLQDQAFRWGPGASRFLELKRNSDKPIPISPLIALDRERCILCYRCTRFSNEVAQDNQLITRERGGSSVIATFEGRPYEGHFSGNVVELCPVGALTSTEFRFKARPWEAPDHPTVCGLCPVGCNTYETVREGQVVRVLARENDAVDEGWLCDRGRFSYTSLYHPDRLLTPMTRANRERPAGNRPGTSISLEGGLDWLYQHLAAPVLWQPDPDLDEDEEQLPPSGALWVLSGHETLEEAYAIQQLAAVTKGTVTAVDGGVGALPQHPATLADVAAARHILVVGDADLAEIAPIVDLRVRKALRDGASVTVAGIGGTRLEPAGAQHEVVEAGGIEAWVQAYATRMRETMGDGTPDEPGVVIFRDGELSEAAQGTLADVFQFPRDGSGFLAVPGAPNARGLAALGIEPLAEALLEAHDGGLVFFNVDPGRHWPDDVWRPAVRTAAWCAMVGMHQAPIYEVADLILPATSSWEKEGTLVNLEGRLQRLSAGATAPSELKPELSWLAGLARRCGTNVTSYSAGAFRQLAAANFGRFPASRYADIPKEGVLGVSGGTLPRSLTPGSPARGTGEILLYVAPFLYDAPDVEHAPRMEFLRDSTYVTLARADADRLGLRRGDVVEFKVGHRRVQAKVAVSRRLAAGYARAFAGAPGLSPGREGWHGIVPERVAVRDPEVEAATTAGVSG